VIVFSIYFTGFILTLLLTVRGFCALFSTRSREAIRKHPIVHGTLFMMTLLIWFAPWGAPIGTLQAASDNRAGVFRLHTIQVPGPARVRFALSEILQEKYGVRYMPLRGCIALSRNEQRYQRAYDQAMLPALQTRFGSDFLKESLAEAEERATQEEKTPGPASAKPVR
jgi:hypothetical protein